VPYSIHYDQENDFILITVQGELDLPLLQEMASGVAKMIHQVGCNRILNDLRKARMTDTTVDIYNMPKTAQQAGVVRVCKRALVVSEETSNFHFLETVFVNQGHQVRLFTEITEAKEWLFGK
jgi:hypothetical protein